MVLLGLMGSRGKKYSGKQFELDFQKSIPNDIWFYRFRDSAGWSNSTNTRFSTSNICDFEIYNKKDLFYVECKKTSGVSLPFSNIKQSQIDGLVNASEKGVVSGFLIWINELCFWLNINKFIEFKSKTERKSLPLSYLEKNGVNIPLRKLKKNYRYDLTPLIGGEVT